MYPYIVHVLAGEYSTLEHVVLVLPRRMFILYLVLMYSAYALPCVLSRISRDVKAKKVAVEIYTLTRFAVLRVDRLKDCSHEHYH